MDLLTKRKEELCPTCIGTEVGIVGINLEPDAMTQTIEHRIHHILYLNEETTVDTDMIYHFPSEGFINLAIGFCIQLFYPHGLF